MSQVLNHDGSITVMAYSLHEFSFELCELASKGFTVTLENNKVPSGGMGSYYSAILVPVHHYRIGLDGTHYNAPLAKDETKATESVTSAVKTTRTTKKTV